MSDVPAATAAGPAQPGADGDGGARLLRHVAIVTQVVPDLDPVVAAWQRWLGFRLVAAAPVAADLAAAWGTPAMAGRPSVLLAPASGTDSWLRFVAGDGPSGHGPPLTCGWSATELLVQDVDGLAASFRGTPFRIVGGPADLFPRPRAPRAMQVRGPAGELVYFTRLYPNGSRYGLKPAQSPVDRPFIITVAGRSLPALEAFWGDTLGLRILDRMPFINPILADACGVSPATIFPTTIVRIPGRSFVVELDGCPPGTPDRPVPAGQLPPGMAMVAFHVASLDAVPVPFRAPPRAVAGPGYGGRRVAVTVGPAGEWLELIETGVPDHG